MQKSILSRIAADASLTPFQRAVYRFVASIPSGKTATYAEVARAIGNQRAVRAVGNALNKNPFAPAVPCHRVIRSDDTIGGFAQGTVQKRKLLRKEGASVVYS